MKTVKFKELPEKVREFLQREYAFAFILSDSVELDWLHKINEWSKATDEERLAYAEWRYKEGTKFKKLNLFRDGGKEIVSSGEIEISSAGIDVDGNFLYYVDVNSSDPTQVNKWAEIISEPEKEEQPEFKAGDEVEVRYNVWNEGEWRKRTYGCFLFGKHWCRHKSELEMVSFDEIRKSDPDKVYREIANKILSETLSHTPSEIVVFRYNTVEQMLIEAIKKGKEL